MTKQSYLFTKQTTLTHKPIIVTSQTNNNRLQIQSSRFLL
uniref:Uncharacterized protein n=1 Tax=Ciona intestinalis TaxID=7719 RepID=H2XQH3_CIOIN